MKRLLGGRARVAALIAVVVGVAAGGIAYASIPDAGGVIHGCYKKKVGTLRVVDPGAGGTCKASETSLDWSQTGPQGPPGADGAQGPPGADGAQGPPGPGSTNVLQSDKDLTLSSPGFTSLISVHLTGTQIAGGRIFYTIRATDGGSQIATEEGVIQWLATANSITCTVQTVDKLHLGTVNSGCTPGFFNPGSQPGVSIFDVVAFSTPAPIVIHHVWFRAVTDADPAATVRLEP